MVYLIETGGKTNKQIVIVGLVALKSSLVSNGLTAFVASVNDDKALLGVGKSLNGSKNSLALVGSVAGIYINVKRAETEGTMVSRGVSEWFNLSTAILTDKARIILFESLVFHSLITSLTILQSAFRIH